MFIENCGLEVCTIHRCASTIYITQIMNKCSGYERNTRIKIRLMSSYTAGNDIASMIIESRVIDLF